MFYQLAFAVGSWLGNVLQYDQMLAMIQSQKVGRAALLLRHVC